MIDVNHNVNQQNEYWKKLCDFPFFGNRFILLHFIKFSPKNWLQHVLHIYFL